MKVVFILYESRSGSTFLASELAKFDKVFVTPEAHYVSQIFEFPVNKIKDQKDLDKIIYLLYAEKHFVDLNISETNLRERLSKYRFPISKKELIEEITLAIFNRNQTFEDDDVVVIKHSPIDYIESVEEVFSDVRFIQTIRDPRAVYASQKNSIGTFGSRMSKNPLRTAFRWKKVYKRGEIPKRCIQIKYEDLILDKKLTVERICTFLSFTDKNLQLTDFDYQTMIGKSQVQLHTNVGKKPLVERINKWEHQLTNYEKWVIHFILWKYIASLGYKIIKFDHVFLKILSLPMFCLIYLYYDLCMYIKFYAKVLKANRRVVFYKLARKLDF